MPIKLSLQNKHSNIHLTLHHVGAYGITNMSTMPKIFTNSLVASSAICIPRNVATKPPQLGATVPRLPRSIMANDIA